MQLRVSNIARYKFNSAFTFPGFFGESNAGYTTN